MFCPKCRAEFKEGITKCSDCGVPLVEAKDLPPEPRVDYGTLVPVFETGQAVEAGFIRSLLESSGIEAFILNEHVTALNSLLNYAIPIVVMVAPENEARAKEIVEQYYADQLGG